MQVERNSCVAQEISISKLTISKQVTINNFQITNLNFCNLNFEICDLFGACFLLLGASRAMHEFSGKRVSIKYERTLKQRIAHRKVE